MLGAVSWSCVHIYNAGVQHKFEVQTMILSSLSYLLQYLIVHVYIHSTVDFLQCNKLNCDQQG